MNEKKPIAIVDEETPIIETDWEHLHESLCDAINKAFERPPKAMCWDCGLDYKEFGSDITFSNSQWNDICPEASNGGGLLCGTCIARRVNDLPGSIAIRAVVEIVYPVISERIEDGKD